jgi:cytidylate kinase
MANRVVTIGRQCGSGGHTIGKLVAQRLGVDFYDKKIVELTAAKTKLSPDFIRSHGEYFHGGAIGHIIGYGTRFGSGALKTGSALTDQLQQAQSEILLEAAAKGPCVIVGRCADCVLAGKADTLNVFIHSEMSFKIERSIAEHGLEREKAASILARRDKAPAVLAQRDRARARLYTFFTEQRWGDAANYDLCLDSGRLGVESCVALIAEAYRCMG